MVKKEKYIFTSLISILSIVLFSLLYFIIPFPIKDKATYIVNYFLAVIVAIILVISFFLGYGKRKDVEGLVLRLPLIKSVIIFEIINLVLCIIQLTLDCIFQLPSYISFILYLFEILIYSILYLVKKQNINHIETNEDVINVNTSMIKELRIRSTNMVSLCKDDISKQNISLIADKLKYSDPVSNENCKAIENEISNLLDELEQDIKSGKVVDSIKDILVLIENRNNICMKNK